MSIKIRIHNMYVKKEDPDPDKRSDIKVHYYNPRTRIYESIEPRDSSLVDPNYGEVDETTVTLYVEEHISNERMRFNYLRTYVEWRGGETFHGIVYLIGSYSSDGIATIEILHDESSAERLDRSKKKKPTTVNVQIGGN